VLIRSEDPNDIIDLAHTPDFALGTIMVRPSSRELEHAGNPELLEPRVMQVLVALAAAGGAVVSRDDLVRRCWEGRSVGEDAINRCIAKLRRIAETAGGRTFNIDTIPRVGYRLLLTQPAAPSPQGSISAPTTAAITQPHAVKSRNVFTSPVAIVTAVALAVLGARLFRLGAKGFLGLLATSAVAVLWIVSRGLAQPGPNHLRSAFSHGASGLIASFESRLPLSYVPALRAWQLGLPLLISLGVAFALAWRGARQQSTRDLLLALGVAIATSLLVNDSAAYELAAGIAVFGAFARFAPAPAPTRARVFARAKLEPELVPSESPPG